MLHRIWRDHVQGEQVLGDRQAPDEDEVKAWKVARRRHLRGRPGGVLRRLAEELDSIAVAGSMLVTPMPSATGPRPALRSPYRG